MKPLNALSWRDPVQVHSIALSLQNAILESREFEVEMEPSIRNTGDTTYTRYNKTKAVLLVESLEAIVDGCSDELMLTFKQPDGSLSHRPVRITIETL